METVVLRFHIYIAAFALCLACVVNAQNPEAEIIPAAGAASNPSTIEQRESKESVAPVVATNKNPAPAEKNTKKMVQDATINLQTTVTGNQEQPRVLYILPWQSPAPEDVDFESLSNDQRVVFGHVEREELRRELESAGEE